MYFRGVREVFRIVRLRTHVRGPHLNLQSATRRGAVRCGGARLVILAHFNKALIRVKCLPLQRI